MVEYFCCPAPNPRPDGMELNDTTKRYRTVLKTLVYGEIGQVIGQAFIYGFMQGGTQIVNMWITYVAFASMHPCVTVIMGFCSAMELLMHFMNASDGGTMQKLIFDSKLSTAIFFCMFFFCMTKLVCAFRIYKEFKAASEGYINVVSDDDNFMNANNNNNVVNGPQQVGN